jgi:hypothetical protein
MSSRAGIPIALRKPGPKGPAVSAETEREAQSRSGWGARLMPAHCHSFLKRVERYRE